MPYYRRTIKSGRMVEVEYYYSIKERNRPSFGRSVRQSLTPEKQKRANDIRAEKSTRRLIANNFTPGKDLYLTLRFKVDMTEEEADRYVNNFIRRLKYYCKKHGLPERKYVGALECGKRGKRWHFHLVINEIDFKVLIKLWGQGPARIFVEQLYADGGFKDLARYLRKDVTGKKRLKQSRNLIKPTERVTKIGKKKLREFERGVAPDAPKGFYMSDFNFKYNDLTGTSAVFVFLSSAPVEVGKVGLPYPSYAFDIGENEE